MAKGKEMEAILKIVGNLDPSLGQAVAGAQKAIGGLGKGLAVVGGAAAAGLAVAGTAMAAAAKGALDLGKDFDEASDTIRIGTGATGDALDALNASFDEVYKSVPTTMEAASQAIADYNTRLGLTGPELEGISEQAIQVSNMLGDDLGGVIESSSQAFQQWEIDAEDMGDAMDYVFKASQSTGTGFTDLMNDVQRFGPQMQELGFSFEETTALIGQLDKAGVNSSEVMSALKKSVGVMAKEGLTASEGLQQYIEKIQDAGTMAEATAIATEVFGSKAASTMAPMIREGKLSVEELTKELINSDETIMKAAEDTEDFPQKLQKLKASAQVALKPVANEFLNIANDAIPILEKGIENIMPVVTDIMGQIAPIIGGIADTVLPLVMEGVEALGESFQGMIPLIMDAVSGLGENIQGIVPFVQEVATWVAGALQQIMPMLIELGSAVMPVIISVGQSVFSVIQSIVPVLLQIAQAILPPIMSLIQGLAPVVSSVFSALTPVIQAIGKLIQTLLPPLISHINNIIPIVTEAARIVGTVLVLAFNTLKPVIETITDLIEAFGETVSRIFGAISGIVKSSINAVISVVNGAISKVNSISVTIPDWAGGGTLGFNIPMLPTLAKGGFTQGVSIAGEAGQEAVISFDTAYRAANLEYWMKAGQLLGALNNDGGVNSDSALAGRLLAIDDFSLSELANSGSNTYVYDFSGMQFNPTINAEGGGVQEGVMDELRKVENEFLDWLDAWLRRREEAQYA